MMKLRLVVTSIITLIITTNLAFSQSKIKGKVSDSNNEPIANAYMKISGKNLEKHTVTDNNGNFVFEIKEIDKTEKNIILEVSVVGYSKATESIDINNISENINIVLLKSIKGLQAVEVIGRSQKDYNSDYSFSATKIAIKNKEVPQAISSVTKEIISDRQAFQLSDVVKVVSSVTPTGFYNHNAIRGITQNEGGQIINGMRTRQFYFAQPLTANIERVEVIKGPSSTTFSSVDPGGSINMVTKKPLLEKRKSISVGAGSFNTMRGSLDFTGPLDESKKLLYRINGAYQESSSFRDLINNQYVLISPSFSYIPNENTMVNAEFIYSDITGYLDRGQPIYGAIAGVTKLDSTPISTNLGRPDDFNVSKEFIFTTSVSQKIAKNTRLNLRYMKQTWEEDLQEHRSLGSFAKDVSGNEVNTLVRPLNNLLYIF